MLVAQSINMNERNLSFFPRAPFTPDDMTKDPGYDIRETKMVTTIMNRFLWRKWHPLLG